MLKLSRKTEYALMALRHLSGKSAGELTSSKEIAGTYRIPGELLAKTLQQLAREGIVETVQGPHGGYRLKANLNLINLSDFIELLEGPVALTDCSIDNNCSQIMTCTIRTPIHRINEKMKEIFSNTTLAEVMQ
ncbi:MAG: Rrf2 family transcriptional regulator [Candidatus Marinimicrobia bacterium]|nr:Rrf2 family transcriptional regulator [Candidatus Neomarinimicrobiota bacterium]